MVRKTLLHILETDSQFYARYRLQKELSEISRREIRDTLEFEINMYEELPDMLDHNYYSIDHFLDYISEVKNKC
jgi:Trm5-related predicted tRNA methylase